MTILTFSYRSIKKEAYLRLRYRNNSTSIEVPTGIKVSKTFWDNYKKGKAFQGENKDLRAYVDNETEEIKKYVLAKISQTKKEYIDRDWLKAIINNYHYPPIPQGVEVLPHNLLDYWDYYTNLREHELKEKIMSWRRWFVIKHKVERFQESTGTIFEIKDVNEVFKKKWVEYCKAENYSNATIQKEFAYIKTLCTHAKTKGIETSPELDKLSVKLKRNTSPKIYLSFDELDRIKALTQLTDYLDNARDWLLISCYTGQRVSDFMRYDKSMIRTVNGTKFLDVKQKKTGKDVTIPLLPNVLEVLEKRNGQFPRTISDQRYNDYIKEVVKLTGIDTPTKGAVKVNNRNSPGTYPKWQLVTSHIGRRSFATNFYGKIPTTYLKNITGHGTEAMLLAYIGKTSKDTAVEAYELMIKATK